RLEKDRANEQGQGLWRRAGSSDSVERIDGQLADARSLLHDMDQTPAEAVDYLPRKMKDFPDHLRRLVVEMLMNDDSKSELQVTQFVIDNARSRYHRLSERTEADKKRKENALADIQELAKRLGLY